MAFSKKVIAPAENVAEDIQKPRHLTTKGRSQVSHFASFPFFPASHSAKNQLPQIAYLRSNLLVWRKQLCLVLQPNHRKYTDFSLHMLLSI